MSTVTKSNVSNVRSAISSFKADLDALIVEEFYADDRSPSYAVRFLENAVQNHPITESQLARHNLVENFPSKGIPQIRHGSEDRPMSAGIAARLAQGNGYVVNSMHMYLSPTELVRDSLASEDSHLGRPTRTTLLRDRMRLNGYRQTPSHRSDCHRLDHSRLMSPSSASHVQMSHGFIVGARYNSPHFLERSGTDMNGRLMTAAEMNKRFPASAGTDDIRDAQPPPNSPFFVDQSEASIYKNTRTPPHSPTTRHNPRASTDDNISLKQPSVKPPLLPEVMGIRCSNVPSEMLPTSCSSSLSKHSWSRAAVNLNVNRQRRNRHNRRNVHPSPLDTFRNSSSGILVTSSVRRVAAATDFGTLVE